MLVRFVVAIGLYATILVAIVGFMPCLGCPVRGPVLFPICGCGPELTQNVTEAHIKAQGWYDPN